MNRARFLKWALLSSGIVAIASPAQSANSNPPPAPYSYIHHAVSTDVPAAQFAFDRGLTLVFAYQPDEAEQAFREAARLDPSLAMAWWGIALAVGPNINVEPELKSTGIAWESIARAQSLATKRATPEEREYVAALSARYSNDSKPDFDQLAVAYRSAMRALVQRRPEDPDAVALYAESIMDLRPWRLWTADGDPAPDTQELVAFIERGLSRYPGHLGLMHYYIHAVEASNDAARALPVARRLGALPMEAAAAHLVHMPAHIYLRVGDWRSAVEANEHAIQHALDYRVSKNPKQERACGHCVDFLTYAYMMEGDQAQARHSASDYQQLSGDPSNAIAVLVRFRQWEDLLSFPEPAPDLKLSYRDTHAVRGFWHFGRGLAFAATTRVDRARGELEALLKESELAPREAVFGTSLDVEHVLDKISQTGDAASLRISAAILGARIAQGRGQLPEATRLLREAVRLQDAMPYSEPPAWFYPVRESLGALLLKSGSPAEADAVFREGLRRSPNNPRLLLGLSEALRAEGHDMEAAKARSEFAAAWRASDANLTTADL
jgi:tetratricopeptide (TPR) repeat protein